MTKKKKGPGKVDKMVGREGTSHFRMPHGDDFVPRKPSVDDSVVPRMLPGDDFVEAGDFPMPPGDDFPSKPEKPKPPDDRRSEDARKDADADRADSDLKR